MSSHTIMIDKFTGKNNFSLWRIKMRALLKQQGIWTPLSGERPDEMTESEFAKQDEKAHSTILLSLADEVIYEVADEESAASLWLKLESLYMTKSLTNKLLLKQRLFSLRMKEGMLLKEHLDELNSILMDLKNVEVKIDDEDAALILLVSLPPSYENFVNSFVVGRDTITMEEVRSSLHSRELRHKASGSGSEIQSVGLSVVNGDRDRGREKEKGNWKSKGRSRSKTRGPGGWQREGCHYCKEPGHWKNECPKLRAKGSAAVVNDDSGSEDDLVLTVVANDNSSLEDDLVLSVGNRINYSVDWILDTGGAFHMTPHKEWFSSYEKVATGSVSMGNDMPCDVVGIGSVSIKMHDGIVRTLTDVRHVPEMKKNLISLGVLDKKGFKYSGGGGVIRVTKGALVVMKGVMKGTLYFLEGSTIVGSAAPAHSLVENESDLTRLWHMRLGHVSEKGMVILSKKGLLGGHKVADLAFCEHCIFGKQRRVSFSKAVHTTKSTLDYLHADCWGPSQVPSLGGGRYFLSIIDDYSRMTWVFILKHKSEAFGKFKDWKVLIENQVGKKIKRLRTDNGLEFCSGEFDRFCKDEGIARHRTVRHTPQQNGVTERMNRTLLERVRCVLSNAGLSRSFWAEALNTVCYLVNRSPATAIDCKTPFEVWSGKPADYTGLRVFGCPSYYHVNEGKLEPKSKKGLFMGYGDDVKGYRIWSLGKRKVILSRDVVFDEESMLRGVKGSSTPSVQEENVSEQVEFELNGPDEGENPIGQPINMSQNDPIVSENQQNPAEFRSIALDKPGGNKPVRYGFDDVVAYALQVAEDVEFFEPFTYKEAVTLKEADMLVAARNMDESKKSRRLLSSEVLTVSTLAHRIAVEDPDVQSYRKSDMGTEAGKISIKKKLVVVEYCQDFEQVNSFCRPTDTVDDGKNKPPRRAIRSKT
ncbi:LOW QUALITY PROTEIN: hypothetical protein OSB04_009137 [Centaurea solstitialis]|uniref:Retrovirus-related Pol polyprotein from transposon TNT 1-94 n=1 Tax=Centaurea solstitialis TaxID=347529 RepID=A0AA38WK69_9ASTR|nr:LOW QUALITY PROTEIN: hypothetical protein OSB04_009137 [Centaurea solstitialis]